VQQIKSTCQNFNYEWSRHCRQTITEIYGQSTIYLLHIVITFFGVFCNIFWYYVIISYFLMIKYYLILKDLIKTDKKDRTYTKFQWKISFDS